MTEDTTIPGELNTVNMEIPSTTIRAAIAWGIINVSDELIYWFLLGIGAIAMISGRDVPEWYVGVMLAILADLLKKKFHSEE